MDIICILLLIYILINILYKAKNTIICSTGSVTLCEACPGDLPSRTCPVPDGVSRHLAEVGDRQSVIEHLNQNCNDSYVGQGSWDAPKYSDQLFERVSVKTDGMGMIG